MSRPANRRLKSSLGFIAGLVCCAHASDASARTSSPGTPPAPPQDLFWKGPIEVCWESSGYESFEAEKALVRRAVQDTWMSASGGLDIRGWRDCGYGTPGIRIYITDDLPQIKAVGTKLSAWTKGITLNFKFQRALTLCSNPQLREGCIRGQAIHAFGHALGFVHDADRPGMPADCKDQPVAVTAATPAMRWDTNSAVGYCGIRPSTRLSPADAMMVDRAYGPPRVYSHQYGGWCAHAGAQLLVADLNGDDYDDLVCHDRNTGKKWVAFGRFPSPVHRLDDVDIGVFPFSRSYANEVHWDTNFCSHPSAQFFTADVDGDGRDDFVCHDKSNGHKWVVRTDERGMPTTRTWDGKVNHCTENLGDLHIGDVNGDGRDDLICHKRRQAGDPTIQIALATVHGRWDAGLKGGPARWCVHDGAELHVADVDGDARADLVCHDKNTGHKWVALGKADGSIGGTSWEAPIGWCNHAGAELHVADVTGDFKADLVCHDRTTGHKWIAKNDGSAAPWQSKTTWESAYAGFCSHASGEFHLARLREKTRRSFVCHDRTHGQQWVSWPPEL